jgi:hypothetical protein
MRIDKEQGKSDKRPFRVCGGAAGAESRVGNPEAHLGGAERGRAPAPPGASSDETSRATG